jgi:hypothetical protein
MKIYAMIYASGEKKKIVPPILGSTVKTNYWVVALNPRCLIISTTPV